MPIDSSKFRSNSLTGTVRVTNGYANISLPTAFYALEGNINFNILVRTDGFSGTTVFTSPTVTLRDPSSIVSLTANTASVNEGDLVAFTLVTANVFGAANLYYSVFPVTANVTADDFVANTGLFTITNNAATFTLKANADVSLVDETGETFKLQVRTVSPTGNAVYTSSNVVILDTYKTYNILGLTADSSSPITNGDNVTFTFSATNVPSGTLFYYSTTGNVTSFASNIGSFALNSLSNTFAISNPQPSGSYNVVVKTGSQSGPIVRTSNTLVVNYVPPQYLWAWGRNDLGIMGDGTTIDKSSPVQIGSLTNWSMLGNTYRSNFVVKTNGTFWSWGGNAFGELGQGNSTNRSSPTQIGALTNWAKVSTGDYGTQGAIKTDGSLWTWGYNITGVLGIGVAHNIIRDRSSPAQLGALTNWSSISFASLHVLSTKTDGTLWTWGRGSYGMLGLGNTASVYSPVQVGSLTNWLSVSASQYVSAAIKTDGTLWTWGHPFQGGLGHNSASYYSSPKQVGALTNWLSVSAGYMGCRAIKTDGTLWSWGRNIDGELGLGDTTSRSSPVQVGNLTNWSSLGAKSTQNMAIKTDGTLWAWGQNNLGILGLGDTISRSSPTQVGTSSNWLKVAAGGYATIATASAPKSLSVTNVVAGTASPIDEGTNVTYTVTATDVTLGTVLYYSTRGNVDSFTSNTGSFVLNGASNTFIITNPQVTTVSANAYYNVDVKTGSQSGNVVFTSNTMYVAYVPPPPPKYITQGPTNGDSEGKSVAVDSTGNIYTIGTLYNTANTSLDISLIKYNGANGEAIWQYKLDSGYSDAAFCLHIDSSDNIFVGGRMLGLRYGQTYTAPYGESWVAKFNNSGAIQWQRKIAAVGYGSEINAITTTNTGNVIVGGYSSSPMGWMAKLNSVGVVQWFKTGGSRVINSIVIDSSDNMYVSGGWGGSWPPVDGGLIKMDSSGNQIWRRAIHATGLALSPSGNLYISFDDARLAKLSASDGSQIWQRILNNGTDDTGLRAGYAQEFTGPLAIDSAENIYWLSRVDYVYTSNDGTQNSKAIITKHNSSGTQQWQRQMYVSGVSYPYSFEYLNRIAVDNSNSLYVTGRMNQKNIVAKLPTDGSLTGTYTVGGRSIVYSASTITEAAGTASINTDATELFTTSASYTEAADSYTANATSYSITPVILG